MAAPLSITASQDLTEYSRYEVNKQLITLSINYTGPSTTGEQVLIQLIKNRRNRDYSVASWTTTLSGDGSDVFTINLPDVVDSDQIYLVRRGSYFIKVSSVTNSSISGITPNFWISIITVENFKKEYLFGIPLRATDKLTVLEQPRLITGVTVGDISKGTPIGPARLSYNYNDPGGGGTPVRTLSWCGGPEIALSASRSDYVLQTPNGGYVRATVNFSALPVISVAEVLLIEPLELDDQYIRDIINKAESWLEKNVLARNYLEPTNIISEIDKTEVVVVPGSTIPIFVESVYDEKVSPLTYFRPTSNQWINFVFPYSPIQKFYSLYGKISGARILDLNINMIQWGPRNFVQVVPYNSTNTINFTNLLFVQSIQGNNLPIPSFWNFHAVVGFNTIDAILIEIIAKKAAVDLLGIVGASFRPGLGSTSLSRDSISESVSYTNSQQFGIYSAMINNLNQFLDENIPRVQKIYKGIQLSII